MLDLSCSKKPTLNIIFCLVFLTLLFDFSFISSVTFHGKYCSYIDLSLHIIIFLPVVKWNIKHQFLMSLKKSNLVFSMILFSKDYSLSLIKNFVNYYISADKILKVFKDNVLKYSTICFIAYFQIFMCMEHFSNCTKMMDFKLSFDIFIYIQCFMFTLLLLSTASFSL